MAKKTIYGTCYDISNNVTPRYLFYAEVKTGEQNVDENYTPVTVGLKVCRNPEYPYAASAYNLTHGITVKLSIDGTEVYSTTKADIDTRNGKVWTFTTQTVNVDHNADGSKTMSITASFTGAGVSSLNKGTLSGSMELDTIPRASSITSAGTVDLGNKCNVKWTPASADFYYKLNFSMGYFSDSTDMIHPKQTTAFTYTGYIIPKELAILLPNSNTGTMTVTLFTYSDKDGTAPVGDPDSKTFTVRVPSDGTASPSVTMVLSPVHDLPDVFASVYIQGKSKVKAEITAVGKHNATIKKRYIVDDNGVTYGAETGYTTDYLSRSGKTVVYGWAEDSRGISGNTEAYVDVIGYSKPKLLAASGEKNVVAARCDKDGNFSDSGTYLKIKAKRSYSPVEAGGVQKNFCAIRYRYKIQGGSYSSWVTILAATSLGSDEITTGALLGGALAEQTTYLVQVQAIDDIGEENTTTIVVPTETIYCHRTRNAMGLGKYVEGENLLDVAWDAKFRGDVMIGDMTLREYILQIMSEGV